MQLSEGAGESCFTALIWAGYDTYALLIFEVKVIAHDGCVFMNEFILRIDTLNRKLLENQWEKV